MKKHLESTDPNSCWSRAKDDEIVFVLLGRDAAAPAAIRAWCERRILLGKNTCESLQIQEALNCADDMENEKSDKIDYIDNDIMCRMVEVFEMSSKFLDSVRIPLMKLSNAIDKLNHAKNVK